jgi:hypothetical protein
MIVHMTSTPLSLPNLTSWLGLMALALPFVLALVLYDVRWIVLSVRAGRRPPWGTWARLGAAVLCHGGAWVLAARGPVWPRELTLWWMHMLLDPGLTLYALGLWELSRRLTDRGGMLRPALPGQGGRDAGNR